MEEWKGNGLVQTGWGAGRAGGWQPAQPRVQLIGHVCGDETGPRSSW